MDMFVVNLALFSLVYGVLYYWVSSVGITAVFTLPYMVLVVESDTRTAG